MSESKPSYDDPPEPEVDVPEDDYMDSETAAEDPTVDDEENDGA